jgi:hypothetical protein
MQEIGGLFSKPAFHEIRFIFKVLGYIYIYIYSKNICIRKTLRLNAILFAFAIAIGFTLNLLRLNAKRIALYQKKFIFLLNWPQ